MRAVRMVTDIGGGSYTDKLTRLKLTFLEERRRSWEIVPAPTTRRQDTTWWSHGLMVKSHLNSINLSITYHVPLKAIIHWPPLSHSRGLVVSWSQFKFLFYNPSHPFSWSRGLMVSWLIKIFKNSTPSCLFSWSHGLVVSWSQFKFSFYNPSHQFS